MYNKKDSTYNQPWLKVIQINLRHCSAASLALADLLNRENYDVALVQEPYAHSGLPVTIANVPDNFITFHALTTDHAYDSAILVRKSLAAASNISSVLMENHVACVSLATRNVSLQFASLYLRPITIDYSIAARTIISAINSPSLVLASDVNAKNKIWNSNNTDWKGNEIETILMDLNLSLCNVDRSELSFVPGGTSFVDITITGRHINHRNWEYLPVPSLSDHPYISFEIFIGAGRQTIPVYAQASGNVPRVQNIDNKQFCNQLENHLATEQQPIRELQNHIEALQQIENITSAITISAKSAKKQFVPYRPGNRNMPWWSEDLKQARNAARKSFQRWSACRSRHNRETYTESKSIYQKLLRKAKLNSISELEKLPICETFKALRRHSQKQKPSQNLDGIKVDNKTISDANNLATHCALHFFPSIEDSTEAIHQILELRAKEAVCSNSPAEAPPITEWELTNAIKNLNVDSAPGSDGISVKHILLCFYIIKDHLLAVLNFCLQHSFWPVEWKTASVTIIRKQGKSDYTSLNNYRPIANGLTFAKIYEKIILTRLTWLSDRNCWLSTNQHGFREGMSTTTAAHALAEFIENSFNQKRTAAACFLDIKSAFDSAWHPSIICALIDRNCPTYLVKSVQNYLSQRAVKIRVNSVTVTRDVAIGCPQGGILSPFLWNILIDDVLRLHFTFNYRIIGFADDLTLLTDHKITATAVKNLQLVLDTVNQLLANNRLKLNATKTKLMLFNKKNTSADTLNSLRLNQVNISTSTSTKFLGLLLDTRLKWDAHVTEKCLAAKRAYMMAYNTARNIWGKYSKRISFLYKAIAEPVLLYACSVWVNYLRTNRGTQKILSFQRSLVRRITAALNSAPTDALIILSNTTPADLRVLELAARDLLKINHRHCFAPSSRALVINKIPEIASITPAWNPRTPHLSDLPPWSPQHQIPTEDQVAAEFRGDGGVSDHLFSKLPKNNLLIRKLIRQRWENNWTNSTTGRATRLFFPNLASTAPLNNLPLSSQLTQLITSHSLLNEHLFRIKLTASAACNCGANTESTTHFLFDCPTYDNDRYDFKTMCLRLTSSWPPSLSDIPKHSALWCEMARFVSKTKRFKRPFPVK